MNLRVFVMTCDRYLWALKGFIHQFQKYWSTMQPVVIAGYALPDFTMPPNFVFRSIAPKDYGKDRWSTGLIEFLESVNDKHFILLLEDYWLCRMVNHLSIGTLYELCTIHPEIIRMDLTDDRLYAGDMGDFGLVPYYGCNDIIYTPPTSPYQMSLQAAIWNREALLSILQPDQSAWQVEIGKTSNILKDRVDLWVLGTRQRPVRYANVFQGGDPKPESLRLEHLLPSDIEELHKVGAIPEEVKDE